MRSAFISEINDSEEYVLTGDVHHHLVNVVRIRVDEELLLLNGKGLRVKTKVKAIGKKEIQLINLKREVMERSYCMDLALGIPKKEALELCLKEATEVAFRRIYLIRAAHSQTKIPEMERLQKLLISALEQSNAPFLPEIIEMTWNGLPWDEYGLKVLMDSQTASNTRVVPDLSKPSLLMVGPEGGFGSAELSLLHEVKGIEILNLPTPILRTPTAVAAGAGCLLQRLMDRR